jgi:hypothetical protein
VCLLSCGLVSCAACLRTPKLNAYDLRRAIASIAFPRHRAARIGKAVYWPSNWRRLRSRVEIAANLYSHQRYVEAPNRAACCELIDVYPVLFLLKDHAFPGYWRDADYQQKFIEVADEFVQDIATEQPHKTVAPGAQRVAWWFRDTAYPKSSGRSISGTSSRSKASR